MKIITSVYGNNYASLLIVFLESLAETHSNYAVIVFWSDMDEEIINPIKVFYKKNVQFISVNPDIKLDKTSTSAYFSSLKSGKMLYLNHVYDYLEENENFLIIDCDTIFNKNIEHVFKNDFDVAFTPLIGSLYKNPINTGVIFLKNTEKVRQLTHFMEEHVNYLSLHYTEHEKSIQKYGGADQAAFCRVVNYESDNEIDQGQIVGDINLFKLNSVIYNNFHSIKNFDTVNILHLKGSWQTLVFRGRALKSMKSKGLDALPVFKKFLTLFLNGVWEIYGNEVLPIQRKLGVKIPIYLQIKSGQLDSSFKVMKFYDRIERLYRFCYNKKLFLFSNLLGAIIFRDYKFWVKSKH